MIIILSETTFNSPVLRFVPASSLLFLFQVARPAESNNNRTHRAAFGEKEKPHVACG